MNHDDAPLFMNRIDCQTNNETTAIEVALSVATEHPEDKGNHDLHTRYPVSKGVKWEIILH